MNKAEWILLLVVIGALVGPFAALKAVSAFRQRGKLPPAQPYRNDGDEDLKPWSSQAQLQRASLAKPSGSLFALPGVKAGFSRFSLSPACP